MQNRYLILILLFSYSFIFAQEDKSKNKSLIKTAEEKAKELAKKASIDSYKIISLERDTTFVDTSLTIKKEYEFNYLRKDTFGLMPFPNEGQVYNVLDFGVNKFSAYPEFGRKAKHINYLEVNDIKYFSVATPITELYFKTVMQQGQNVDALITLNTSKQFNFSLAFKGLRSLGRYINQLTSNGNFRFTSSYNTKNKRYYSNFHFTGQDLSNGENGGITTSSDFESEDQAFDNRARIQVYLPNAKSFLKGKRFFLDHNFRINTTESENNLYIAHQFNYEHKFFEFNQPTVNSTIGTGTNATTVKRFGTSIAENNINDQVRYTKLYNKVAAVYENKTLGKFHFFIENFNFNNYYKSEVKVNNPSTLVQITYPKSLKRTINSVGGQYEYRKNNWNAKLLYSNSISTTPLRNLDGLIAYKYNDKNNFTFQYQNISKTPNHIYNLHQSSYASYNWNNDFKNEKINNIIVNANTQWATASIQVTNINDYLYFSNDATSPNQQILSPKQYEKSINYISAKVSKEIKFRKLGFDNTLLYQKVDQSDEILNVPEITLRSTIYYSDYLFKRAMFLQTGVTVNYFTNYFANDYNPILGEFFVQTAKQTGNFPLVDFFVNARIRQTRIFLKAEHFNSSFTGNTFYSAPNTPYRDFTIRFGLVWTFFQ